MIDYACLVPGVSSGRRHQGPVQPHRDLPSQVPVTAFLLAITSGHKASEMHALCYKSLYLQFSNAGVTLITRLGFLPKVFTKANASWPIVVPAMHNQTDVALHKFCVHRAHNEYAGCTSDFRHDCTAQLFVTYYGQVKQRLSKWLVECIKFACDQNDLPTPDLQNGSHIMLTWLVVNLKLFARPCAGQTLVCLPGSIA